MGADRDKTLARSLGEFFGHIWAGVKSDPRGNRQELRRETQEQTQDTADGSVTVRRTTIEEIEYTPGDQP